MSRLALPLATLLVCSTPLFAADPLPAPGDLKPNPFRGDAPPVPPAVTPMVTPAPAAEAEGDTAFKGGNYSDAARWYAAHPDGLTEKQKAAWAYCRIKLASETVNKDGCDAPTAAAVEKDVTAALQLAPAYAGLQQLGQAVIAVARLKANGSRAPAGVAPKAAPTATVPADWETVETPSFTVRFKGTRELAEKVGEAAEAKRKETFERWSGPAGGAWAPRCEVVLHPTADCYAAMTGKPPAGTGHATIQLAEGKVTARRLDLVAGDDGLLANALPRELTHVVLADLFPYTPPPKWAEEAMAVLASSPEEVGRYVRTAGRCRKNGELFTLAALLEMKDFPAAEKITGFYCGSVSLADYLVRLKGEKQFTLFLRDCQRYGTAQALKRQYDIDGPTALQDAWLRAALTP
jgi:hypothetical protein